MNIPSSSLLNGDAAGILFLCFAMDSRTQEDTSLEIILCFCVMLRQRLTGLDIVRASPRIFLVRSDYRGDFWQFTASTRNIK